MTNLEDKKETLESKEEVICPVCSNFEPQAWRKNMCRNCFHSLDEHGANTEENLDNKTMKDKKLENDKVNDMQKKKSETDTSKKKGEPPKTLAKSKNPNLSVDISKKDTNGNLNKSPSSPLKKTGSPFIKSPEVKDFKSKSPLSPTKLTEDLKSKEKVSSPTSQKNISLNKFETKRTESSKDNEKQVTSAPSALSKWKQNENRSVSKDKGPSGEENKQIGKQQLSKVDDNKNKIDEKASKFQSKTISAKDKKEQDPKTPSASLLTNKDNTPKSKTDESSKVRQFAKTFGSDLEESRFNSLERQKKEKSATTLPVNDQCKSGIKNQSTPEAVQKGTISTEGKESKPSALYEKINKFTHSGLKQVDKNDKPFGSLDRRRHSQEKSRDSETSAEAGQRVDAELETVKKQLSVMEIKCKALEQENNQLRTGLKEKETVESSLKSQKSEVENAIKGLRDTLKNMEDKCNKFEGDNTTLMDKLKAQQIQQKEAMKNATKAEMEDMEVQLSASENDVENLKLENEELKNEIQDLKVEMDEMYDSFRDQEAEEFRDLQRELEMTAKNCRVLQFKLRKAERRSEQIELDRQTYEEKLHLLQNQFEDADARAHIRSIEDELRMAKEVSVRLHDELDILDDKRSKVEDDNNHLTRLLEQSDKKQFRLEMEIDKLRDQMTDLRRQLAEKSQAGTPSTEEASDRKILLGRIGKQGSQEQEVSQLMKDLYDSMERETDLKDQLKFAEEETKSMRMKLEELEEENDTLSQQLKKMSSAQVTRREEPKMGTVTETEVELKVQLDLNEQDLLLSKKKIQDYGNENEKLKEEITNLKKVVEEKDHLLHVMPEPSSPNAYYEDKLKEMSLEADDLRWRIIEKERENNCLYVQLSNYQTKKSTKLRKSNSFDSEYSQVVDLKKHVEFLTQENADLKDKVSDLEEQQSERLRKNKSPIRIESQVFESSRQSPAKNNVEMIGKTSLSDANVMFTNSKDGNYLPSSSDQTSTTSIITDTAMQDSKVLEISTSEMAKQIEHAESLKKQLKAVELENQNLQLKMSELMKEIEILQKKNFGGTEENASSQKDAKVSEGESREELMDTILDLEDEVDALSKKLSQRNQETANLLKKQEEYLKQIEKIEDEYRKKELDLLNDLDIAHDKNEILSNLLDIVKERADTAERELERVAASFSVASDGSGRSARVISTCSDVSLGSDEVFDGASPGVSPGLSPITPGSPESPLKRQVIQRDWDNQFRKRIDCLERLLAEERQKLAATEKKLALVSTESISTAMSDDAKLFAREKELLQAEILEGKKLLKIATDQIKGLRERMFTLEEENRCLRATCAAENAESEESENEKTPSYHIDERPSFDVTTRDASKSQNPIDVSNYRERIASLEKQLNEVEAQWRSKCTAIEKEKIESQQRLRELTADSEALRGSLKGFKEDVGNKQKQLREIEEKITVNSDILKRKEEIMNEQEEIIKQREEDLQSLLDQISHRNNEIRDLREKLQPIDEKLKEKEDIIKSLKDIIESKQDEINYQSEEISELNETIELKQNEIDELSGNSKTQNVTKAEWEQDNKQLKNDLETMASNLGKLHTDNFSLQEELEKTKQALSEAMVLWNKDRSQIEIAYNVAKEKLRIYEETAAKKESQIVALLRKETHKLLESKEKISTDFRVTKIEHEANMRTLKSEKLKLQDELTQKIRQLTAEMTSNDKMKEELQRLRAQEDVAYQIQYHEKVLRAEYLAMKVRYETRLENLQKEHMKLLGVLDKLQREKVLNQEMIKGVQKGMGTMKETYTKDLEHWKEERNVLEKHIKEIESSRKLAIELEGKVEELKQQLADQEYERAEIVNRMTSERSKWEVERSGMQSHINQLEEKLDTVAYSTYRTKDMQSRMEVAWESERAEQKRLLNEAHELAMDLQRQLKCRDNEHSRERKALLEQMKRLRKELDEEQLLRERRLTQIELSKKEIEDLKKKLIEMCHRSEKDQSSTMKDKVDLVRRLAEFRRTHKRDQRRIEDILSELTRLRELASIVIDSENPDVECDVISRLEQLAKPSSESKRLSIHANMDMKQKVNEVVLQYMKESLKEIHFAADNLSRPSSRGSTDDERKRLRRSISSSELDFLLKDEAIVDQQIETLKDSRRNTPTKFHDVVSNKLNRNICSNGPGDLMDVRTDDSDVEMPIDPEPGTVNDRHQRILIDVHHEEGVTSKFPVPPPTFLLPKSHQIVSVSSQSSKSVSTTVTTIATSRKVPNSLSLNMLNETSDRNAVSAGASPVHIQNSLDLSNPKSKSELNIPTKSARVSKENARRKFFEQADENDGQPSNMKSISENNLSIAKNGVIISDDSANYTDMEYAKEINNKHGCSSSDSETKLHNTEQGEVHLKVTHPKKKRKLFKKSVSMDTSAVHNTQTEGGVSAASPGAHSSLSPFELFAAVKRRLKPSIKRSSSLTEGRKGRSPGETGSSKYLSHSDTYASSSHSSRNESLRESPISTPVMHEAPSIESGSLIPPPTPPISMMNRRLLPKLQELHEEDDGRKSRGKKKEKKKKIRSKSAERAASGPASLTQDIVFNEDLATPFSHSPFSETSV